MNKLIAGGAGLLLATLAAVGAFASQDAVSVQEDETPTATATVTETPTDTPVSEETEEPEDTATPTVTSTPDDAEEEEEEEEEEENDEESDGESREIKGIPEDNPNWHDVEGECDEKGEAAIKTTPSGVQVRVPCHAAEKKDHGERGNKHDQDDEEDDDGDEEEEQEEESSDE